MKYKNIHLLPCLTTNSGCTVCENVRLVWLEVSDFGLFVLRFGVFQFTEALPWQEQKRGYGCQNQLHFGIHAFLFNTVLVGKNSTQFP